MKVDWAQLSQELVRSLRGKSTQGALSRRLGFKTNVVYRWESGQRKFKVSDLMALLAIRQPDAIERFWQYAGDETASLDERMNGFDYARWLGVLKGDRTVEEVALGVDLKPAVLRRIFRGDSDPPVGRLFMLVQALTGRIIDFIELMTDPGDLKSIRAVWRSVEAQRKTASEHLNAQSIIACLEIDAYRALPEHSNAWLAQTLGLHIDEVTRTIETLHEGGAILIRHGKYTVVRNRYVNTRKDIDVARRLGRHWANRSLQLDDRHCARGHLVFSCSDAALSQIFDVYRRAHHDSVVAFQDGHGQNATRVVCISTQFAFLDGKPKPD